MSEAYSSLDDNMRYYGGYVNDEMVEGVHIPFNFEFISHAREESNAYVYQDCIRNWLDKMPKRPGIHANWLVSCVIYTNNCFLLSQPGNQIQTILSMCSFSNLFFSWAIMIKDVLAPNMDHHELIYLIFY